MSDLVVGKASLHEPLSPPNPCGSTDSGTLGAFEWLLSLAEQIDARAATAERRYRFLVAARALYCALLFGCLPALIALPGVRAYFLDASLAVALLRLAPLLLAAGCVTVIAPAALLAQMRAERHRARLDALALRRALVLAHEAFPSLVDEGHVRPLDRARLEIRLSLLPSVSTLEGQSSGRR